MRIRIDLGYDGTDFHGWAVQTGLRTVQGELSAALATVLRLPRVGLSCAGRTDAGVHARGQVVHLDIDPEVLASCAGRSRDIPTQALMRRLNGILTSEVRVRRVVAAPTGFDARFSALWRRYAYRVCDDPGSTDPLARRHVLAWPHQLDVGAMQQASDALLGQQDFAAYCRRREGATTIRTLLDLSWSRTSEGLLVAAVRADAFCHSMVRSMVGAVLAVGEGSRPLDWPRELLLGQRRHSGLAVAPAHGLTLEEVAYPPDAELGARVLLTRARRA